MSFRPLVSIIIPLYNYEKYIADCIQSALNQDYDNCETIIVDDCSTDGSYEIAKKFEAKNLKVLKMGVNSGYSAAKNAGIVASQGEFVAALDADDMLTRDSVSVRLAAVRKHGVPFVHARAVCVFGNISLKKCYKLDMSTLIIRPPDRKPSAIHAQSALVARWIYQKHGLYDENLRAKADKEMWVRLFGPKYGHEFREHRDFKRVYLRKAIVAYYRKHGKSMMKRRRRDPVLNAKVNDKYDKACAMRLNAITPQNTKMLEA